MQIVCYSSCTRPLLASHQTKSTMTTSANCLAFSAVFLMELNAMVLPPTAPLETMARMECATQPSSSAGPSTTTLVPSLRLETPMRAPSLAQPPVSHSSILLAPAPVSSAKRVVKVQEQSLPNHLALVPVVPVAPVHQVPLGHQAAARDWLHLATVPWPASTLVLINSLSTPLCLSSQVRA